MQYQDQVSISLAELAETLPAPWLEFAPSPITSYIQPVREELEELGLLEPLAATPAKLSTAQRAFQTFCGVPRYFHPKADAEALALSLELICWYFFFDDPFDDGEGSDDLIARMVEVLDVGALRADATPCERLCLRFRERSQKMRTGEHGPWERFIDLCKAWVLSIRPINRQVRQGLTDLETYKELRLVNVGIIPEYALNELMYGQSPDEAFRTSPEVVRFGELAALVIALFNDVYSYERETKQGTQLNSLELRQALFGLSLPRAYEAQLADVRDMVGEMVAIEERLDDEGRIGISTLQDSVEDARRRRAQTRYLDDIKAIVVGNHLWSHSDGRYYSPSSPFVELRERRPDRRRRAGIAPVAHA